MLYNTRPRCLNDGGAGVCPFSTTPGITPSLETEPSVRTFVETDTIGPEYSLKPHQ